jgi:hypothetical protein
MREVHGWLGVLSLLMTFPFCAHAQEVTAESPIFTISSTMKDPVAARMECKKAVDCFDAGPYLVTVVDIIEGDIPGYRKARLVLVFGNLTDKILVLAYRSGSSFMVDDFKNRYSCCQTDSSREDTSAIGIGIDRDGKIDPQFRLNPYASDTVSFDLWRHRPPEEAASHYHFDLMIDEIDPSAKKILRHPVLFFRNLPAVAPEADQKK